MKKHKFALLVAWILALVIVPLPLIWILNTGLIDSIDRLIAYDFGIVAYVWWLIIVYLSTKPKWIKRMIGLPSTYMMHGLLGILAVLAATVHRFTAISYHAIIKDTGNIAWYLEIFLIIYAVVFLSPWIKRITLIQEFKTKVSKLLTPKVSLWIHRLNFAAIALIWLHVNVIPRIANVPNFLLVFDLYTLLFLAMYVYKKFVIREK